MSIFAESDLARLRELYPQQPGQLSHRLLDHPLLTLESLVGLGRRLPRASGEYNAGDLPYGVEPDEVSHTGLSVADTIRRIEQCGSWMVLKHVDQDPAYKALLDDAGELAERPLEERPVSRVLVDMFEHHPAAALLDAADRVLDGEAGMADLLRIDAVG